MTDRAAHERCADCRFWSGISPRDSLADCRRHAPILLSSIGPDRHGELEWKFGWPEALADEWCGEFKPDVDTRLGGTR